MTKYWPLYDLEMGSPPALLRDVATWRTTGNAAPHMYDALAYLAKQTPPRECTVVLVMNIGAPARRLCLDIPSFQDFAAMERSCVFDLNGKYLVHMDALH